MASECVSLFFARTAPTYLCVPECVVTLPASGENGALIETTAVRLTLFVIPSLESIPPREKVVVTLMASADAGRARAIKSSNVTDGSVVRYPMPLFARANPVTAPRLVKGLIIMRQRSGVERDARRVDITQRLNAADFDILSYADDKPEVEHDGRPMVMIEDHIILRIPVREIAKHFATLKRNVDTIVAPGVAIFEHLHALDTVGVEATPHRSLTRGHVILPDYSFSILGDAPAVLGFSNIATRFGSALPISSAQAASAAASSSQNGSLITTYNNGVSGIDSTGWTVIVLIWLLTLGVFFVSSGSAYWWLLRQIL